MAEYSGFSEHDGPERRDIDAEFDTFLLEHDVTIAVEEVFHLNPHPEEDHDIRQHNHVVLRSPRSQTALSLCMTSFNWDDFRVLPPHVLFSLAGDASLLEQAEGNYVLWADSQQWSPDSRGAERKFRQTVEMVAALRRLLGERGYAELIALYEEAGPDIEDPDLLADDDDHF